MRPSLDEMPECMTVTSAAEILGLSRNSCYQAIRNGEIPALRIGSRLIVPRRALEELLSAPVRGRPSADDTGVVSSPDSRVNEETE